VKLKSTIIISILLGYIIYVLVTSIIGVIVVTKVIQESVISSLEEGNINAYL
jgi:hypothetical protein